MFFSRVIDNFVGVSVLLMLVALLSGDASCDDTPGYQPINKIAQNCFNAMGNMVALCEQNALRKYDASRLNTTDSTTWETCCEAYEELDCFAANATVYCPTDTADAVLNYTANMVHFFQFSICQSFNYDDRAKYCYDKLHPHIGPTTTPHPKNITKFIDLPDGNGREKSCIAKLRNRPNNNTESWCIDQAINKWDPTHEELSDGPVKDRCCAIYQSLNCVDQDSRTIPDLCTTEEQRSMDQYWKTNIDAFSRTLCKVVPYSKSGKSVCGLDYVAPNYGTNQLPNVAIISIVLVVGRLFSLW